MRCVGNAARAAVESLESRTLLSGGPLTVSQVSLAGGVQLRLGGTPGADQITIQQTPAGLLATNGAWSQTIAGTFQSILIDGGAGNDSIVVDPSVRTDCILYGGAGSNTLVGGSGNDTLYAGTGRNVLRAGSGNDVLVGLGSAAATLAGGAGHDSFWADANPRQRLANVRADEMGSVHRVGVFFSGATVVRNRNMEVRTLALRHLAEPSTTGGNTYRDFANDPLFGPTGPSPDDVAQGAVGDCFYLAVLSAVAKTDPAKIRQSILDMGDGTYLVQFVRGGSKVFVRVDAQLPVWPDGTPAYAGLGQGQSLWVAIMEKAYAIFHGPGASYASIDGGWMDEAFASMGANPADLYGAANGAGLLSQIQSDLLAGQAVTYGTNVAVSGSSLLDQHAYEVVHVNLDSQGNPVSMLLRNPWGVDGAGNDGTNDGYVTVTAQQAYDSLMGVVSALA